jgi:hypothetical protein
MKSLQVCSGIFLMHKILSHFPLCCISFLTISRFLNELVDKFISFKKKFKDWQYWPAKEFKRCWCPIQQHLQVSFALSIILVDFCTWIQVVTPHGHLHLHITQIASSANCKKFLHYYIVWLVIAHLDFSIFNFNLVWWMQPMTLQTQVPQSLL